MTHSIGIEMERDSRKIIKRLKDEGFELVSVSGSHHKFRKGTLTLIVPHPKKDLPIGTARSIAKDAGWL
ncbi:putative RNA binding protein YcfA (HicA-like mRNA interferase family) [Phyllobacterium sp. P30BS-XVII]|nr:putative RNA binding protein YcfA (HicA-like mRNA interferase family) [Phyllobacterium sp. P30BS-XVII]